MFTSTPIRLPRPVRAAVMIAAAVGVAAAVSATPLPPGVGLLAGAAAGVVAAALTGHDAGEPGPDTPDTEPDDSDAD
jgi:hypothetical protein